MPDHRGNPPGDPGSHRFYATDLSGETVHLTEGEAHHARNVLRLRAGAAVEVFDGAGSTAEGTLSAVGRGDVCVSVHSRSGPVARPAPLVELAFAVPRGKRVDILLEKATELGAARLQPIVFERSVAGGAALSPAKRDRWTGHCIAAAKQCRLNFLPELGDPRPLADYLTGCGCDHRLVGDVDSSARPLATALNGWTPAETICLLVGPEGDITPEEWPAVRGSGFVGVHLGHTTLRVETAAIALLAGVTAICDGMA